MMIKFIILEIPIRCMFKDKFSINTIFLFAKKVETIKFSY